MKPEFTVGRHPNWKQKSSIFKWAIFRGKELIEGFITASAAEGIAEEYNRESA